MEDSNSTAQNATDVYIMLTVVYYLIINNLN